MSVFTGKWEKFLANLMEQMIAAFLASLNHNYDNMIIIGVCKIHLLFIIFIITLKGWREGKSTASSFFTSNLIPMTACQKGISPTSENKKRSNPSTSLEICKFEIF